MPHRHRLDPEARAVARDISYAHSAATKGGRVVIRAMENSTGRLRLIKAAEGYAEDVAQGRDFWDVMVERFKLQLTVMGGTLENIPETGPVVLIANHPYGILDGLMLGHIMAQRRGDFRILANDVFRKAEDLNRVILPVSFAETKAAMAQNLATRKAALSYLAEGGAIGVFPGGTVSTAAKPFGRPMDPMWRSFTARLIAKSGATVVPIYFDGHNSRLFQLMSHLHSTLRVGMLIKEFRARTNSQVKIVVGQPIPREDIAAHDSDGRSLMEFLRQSTYALSPRPLDVQAHGFEFEDKHRRRDTAKVKKKRPLRAIRSRRKRKKEQD